MVYLGIVQDDNELSRAGISCKKSLEEVLELDCLEPVSKRNVYSSLDRVNSANERLAFSTAMSENFRLFSFQRPHAGNCCCKLDAHLVLKEEDIVRTKRT